MKKMPKVIYCKWNCDDGDENAFLECYENPEGFSEKDESINVGQFEFQQKVIVKNETTVL